MNIPKTVPEEFLCFIWENRLFSTDKRAIDNESIEVVHAVDEIPSGTISLMLR